MSKQFVMNPSKKEALEKMPESEVTKYLKNDGYDDLRSKIWQEGITEGQFQSTLLDVERAISFKKEQAEIGFDIIFNRGGKGPLEDRVIILPDKAEKMTAGGLYIPDGQEGKPATGTVISVGPGMTKNVHYEPVGYMSSDNQVSEIFEKGYEPIYKISSMPLRPGDRVYFGRHAGLIIKDPETSKEYLLMRLTDVFVKL